MTCLVFIRRLFHSFLFRISTFSHLGITEETWVVEMCIIWCCKIGNVLVFILTSSSTPLLVDCKSPRESTAQLLSTCFKIPISIELSIKSRFDINSSQNEGLSPSGIWLHFMVLCWIFYPTALSQFSFSDFQIFPSEHYWRVLSSRNADLVQQNW
jgi:hypothetical protein